MGATAAVFWGARLAAIAGTVGAFVAFAAGQGVLVPFLVAFAVVMALVQLLPARQLVSAGHRLR